MPDLVKVDSRSFQHESSARFHYAGLLCMGVPRQCIKVTEDDDCRSIVTVYRRANEPLPPGLPERAEHREAKHAELNEVAIRLNRAIQSRIGWPTQYEVRYNEDRQEYVLAINVVILVDDDRYDEKLNALDRLFKNIFKDTRVQSDAREIEFDHEHRLRAYANHGMTFEFPLSPALLQLARCQTLNGYHNGQEGEGRRPGKR